MLNASKVELKETLTAIKRIRGIAVATIEDERPLDERMHRERFREYTSMWEIVTDTVNKLKQLGVQINHPNPFRDLKELYGYLKGESRSWAGRRQVIKGYYDPLEQQLKGLLERPFTGIEEKSHSEGAKLGEEKKKGLFINVTVDRPEGLVKSYPFFTDVSSGGILEGSSGYSGFHVSSEEFKYIKEMLDKKRGENVEGTLVEATLMKGEKPITLRFTQMKSEIKVFISYAKEDIVLAYQIYNGLKDEGYGPWMDEGKLVGGQDWEVEITRAIEESNFLLACLSNHSVNKEGYFQKELKIGMDILDRQPEGRIYLIPVRLEDCQVPLKLKKRQWVDFFKGDGMERLLRAIETGCKQRECV